MEISNLQQQDHRKVLIEQDKLNRQIPFDPQKQLYPADLFVLVGFDNRGHPIWERNPRWHKDGFYTGRSTR
jgi:hypothetical protein